ncbi:hypothetical protein PT974_07537 [Cladobotryum mycophilum]|uniref:Uncharacterized protein n=1 Tax=Cladobotryum mycophilum TaxID=491253 RepID=A0ABR0SQB5_9HYPO
MRLFLTNLFLTLVSLVWAQREVAGTNGDVDCLTFWTPFAFEGNFGEIVEQLRQQKCRVMEGYPTFIGTHAVTVVMTREWEALYGSVSELKGEGYAPAFKGMLAEAFYRSLPLYDSLSSTFDVPPIVLILTDKDAPAGLTTVIPTGGPCMITGYTAFNGWAFELNPIMKQSIAHELYHCFQQASNPELSLGWVAEGSAEYFSNVVFPQVDHEWTREVSISRGYDPNVPIFDQPRPDTAELWFQALEATRGPVYLHSFMLNTPGGDVKGLEASRLSGIKGFADDFFQFAVQYTPPKTFASSQSQYPTLIRDTNGQYRPVANYPIPKAVTLTMEGKGKSGTARLTTTPFTISQFTFSVDPGQQITLWAESKGNQRLAYRQGGQTFWNELPNAPVTSAAGTLVIPCKDEQPVDIIILFTSTESKGSDDVTIHVSQQESDDKCKCKSNKHKRRGLQECHKPKPEPGPEPVPIGACGAGAAVGTDPCLDGVWNLDLPSTRALMIKVFTSIPVSISSIQVSGVGTIDMEAQNTTWVYNGLKVDTVLEDLAITVVINGKFDANFYIKSGGKGSGSLCMVVYAGGGTAVGTQELIGSYTLPLTGPNGFVPYGMDIQYTCDANRLTLQGTVNSAASWGPFVYTR